MKTKHFSMPGGKPHHGSSQRQHHSGHALGHPTEHGQTPENQVGGPDYGSMAEHGLSEGNVKGLKSALPEHSDMNSVLEEHHLQHTDYGSLTGHNYSGKD